jgi:hypothetical protein
MLSTEVSRILGLYAEAEKPPLTAARSRVVEFPSRSRISQGG